MKDLYRGLVIFFLSIIAVLLYAIMIEISQMAVDVSSICRDVIAIRY